MPVRREISVYGTKAIAWFDQARSRPSSCALIYFGVVALGPTTAALAQETPKPQAESGTSSSRQAPKAPPKVPGAPRYR